jgi:hypothetical protein
MVVAIGQRRCAQGLESEDVLDAGESERPVQPHHFFVEGSVVQGCSLGHLEQIGADHLDMAQSLNLRRRHHRE